MIDLIDRDAYPRVVRPGDKRVALWPDVTASCDAVKAQRGRRAIETWTAGHIGREDDATSGRS